MLPKRALSRRNLRPVRSLSAFHRGVFASAAFRGLRLEPLEQRCLLAADFGDAPLPYPTLLAENGAQHAAVGPTLGPTRDMEADGVHSAGATGDGADENGVTLGSIRVGQLGATLLVQVQGGAAKLDAWIDFDHDGAWGGPWEQISNSVNVSNGANTITFDVPNNALDGVTFARFRLSTAGNLGVRGAAADGEVEDYAVTIVSSTATSGIFGSPRSIDALANGANSVVAADVDGDGDMDALSASVSDNTIAWYENNGAQTFAKHVITTTALSAVSVVAADVDGDGDTDALSASVNDNTIAWYENNGAQVFTKRTISTTAIAPFSVSAADVDGDGDLDALSASYVDDTIAWYENNGSQVFTKRVISTSANGAFSVLAADVDDDGDMDALSASSLDDTIAWYENNGSQTFTKRTISLTADRAYSVSACDVDGDGDLDALSASANDDTIAWYENNGSEVFTKRTVTTTADSARSVVAADIDGDGDTDILSASYVDDTIAWYENSGAQVFTKRVITAAANGASSVYAADVDGDGDLDALSASGQDDRLQWYANLSFDFGDAPAPYPALLGADGARHEANGPMLGASRDIEPNGLPTAAADGDGADEDGVTFGMIRVGQLDATVTVNVRNAPSGAKLDAWIDFNADGSWGGPLEQVASSVSVANGDNVVEFDVPSWAADGQTIARFRLSTAGNLTPRGATVDGEVEDYAVMIAPPGIAVGEFSPEQVIDPTGIEPRGVFAADIDRDGDMDVLSASFNKITWHENDGNQSFTPRTIITGTSAAYSVFAADVDGDGDLDVLSASFLDDTIAWYENNGSQTFTTHLISTTTDGAIRVSAADVDGDGDLDVLSASWVDGKIAWFENNGSQTFTKRVITTAPRANSAVAADVDGDGDMDILSALFNEVAWHENNGSQTFTAHTISTAVDGLEMVIAADVDGDGDLDALSASFFDDKIAWYENNGSQTFTARTITTAANGARSVFAADIDGDGDMDVLSASSGDAKVAWYQNNGSQVFKERLISNTAEAAFSVFAADVDGDSDLDVLSASVSDDKVAWYENDDVDFGDAPAPYPTTLAADGARHIDRGPRLGAARDFELDGHPSASANGDGADEDGVSSLGLIHVGQLDAAITVNVSNAPSGAKLDAWIDFDRDGAWGGPLEQIANRLDVANGNNTITFDVPSWAAEGQTYARFRLSSAGNLGLRGAALDGEVEDYLVTVVPPSKTARVFSGQKVISTSANLAYSVHAADVDGDGDMDALSASVLDAKIAWYENNGSQSFTERTIANNAGGPANLFATDLDGDGDIDVLFTTAFSDVVGWYENNGSQTFTLHIITTAADGAFGLHVADVDGDGDTDVLCASFNDDTIAWYENNGSQTFTERLITTAADGAQSVFTADVDGDGDIDVLSASRYDDTIAWYENNGSQVFAKRTISASADFARDVFAADVDGDGDMDVLSASLFDNKVAWYENDGNQTFTLHTISTDAHNASRVFAADVDGDGDTDVLSASSYDDKIAWYENDGGQVFTPRTISTNADRAYSVFPADVDGDGDLDVLSASAGDDKIAWYENLNYPRIVGVTASGSESTHAPYDLPAGSGEQLRTVPVGGLDRFAIRFDHAVNVSSGDLTVSGTAVPSYAISGFTYDPVSFVATWTLAMPVGADELTLALAASVNTAGLALDGVWTNPAGLTDPSSSNFPSGNGSASGAFLFRITSLPGDANRDNVVSGADYTIWADHFDNGVGAGDKLFAEGDFTGEGYVTGADYTLWADHFGLDFMPAPLGPAQRECILPFRFSPSPALSGVAQAWLDWVDKHDESWSAEPWSQPRRHAPIEPLVRRPPSRSARYEYVIDRAVAQWDELWSTNPANVLAPTSRQSSPGTEYDAYAD